MESPPVEAPNAGRLALSMGKGNFRPLTESTPLNQSPKYFSQAITSATPYGCTKLGAHTSTGGFWAHGWNITKIIFIYTPFEELTCRSEQSTDFHAWWLKRCGLAQGCAFLGCFHMAQKRAYYQNCCIDFNQILHSDKYHQMPFVGGPDTRITNARWRTAAILEKSKHCHILAPVRLIATKFVMVTQFDPLDRLDRYIFEIQKFKMAAADNLKHPKIAISRQRFDRLAQPLALWRILALRTVPAVEISNF